MRAKEYMLSFLFMTFAITVLRAVIFIADHTWVDDSVYIEAGHVMTFREAIITSLPYGIAIGILTVTVIAAFELIRKKARKRENE